MAYLCAENGNLMAIAQQLAQHHQQQTAQQPQNHGHHNLNIYPAATHFLYNTSSGMNINNQWLSPSWTEAQASAGFVPEMVGDLCSTTATTELDLTRAGLFFAEQQPPQSFTDYALMHKPMVMAANNAFRLPELHAFGGFDESPRAAANNEFMAADWMDCLINDEVANNSIVNTAVEACGGISNTAICESTESSEIPYARGSGGCGGGGGDDGSWQSEFCSLGEALRVSSWTETLSEDIISASSVGAGVTLAAAMHDDIKPLVENPKWKNPETTTQVIMKDDGHGQQALDDRHKVVESAASPQLFQSLLDCAKIIDTDRENAQKMISQIKNLANPYGNPTQRIAFYFSDALAIRLNKGKDEVTNDDKCRLLNDVKDGVVTDQEENAKCLEQSIMAYKALNDACPYAKFAHLTANQAILETMESAEKIHIVDFGIVQGVQWAAILQAFATRESGKPRKVKITGIPAPSIGPNPDSALVATGNRLRDFAQLLDLDFEFIPLSCPMSDVEKSMLKVEDDECVAVNFMLQLYHLLGEDNEGILKVLKLAQSLVPKVVTLGEYEANLNSCKFNVRFRNALNYYLAFFDSMEPNMARDSAERGNVEKLFFAEKILGVVAYEGTERKMRLQSRDQWRVLMQSAGFKCLNLSPYAVSQARILLWNYCQTYNLDAACGDFLSLAWNERPLLTVSSWTCC